MFPTGSFLVLLTTYFDHHVFGPPQRAYHNIPQNEGEEMLRVISNTLFNRLRSP